jgi:hypothetical protein
VIVPESPAQLIEEFLPEVLGQLLSSAAGSAAAPSGVTTSGAGRRTAMPAAAGVGLRVVGAGEWTLRIVTERLLVEPGIGSDVALQLSTAARDFEPLVVAPLRRALAQREAGASISSQSLWTRLGRWDAETVELLRRQTGSILLRIQDGELQRAVALTPSTQPFSLDSASCTIDCALSDLEALQQQRGNPLDLFYQGQIRISGDAQIALAMAGLFL